MPTEIKKTEVQKTAEAAVQDFKNDLGLFVVAAETTRMAMAFTDAKTTGDPINFVNDSFLELAGYFRAEVLGQDFNFLLTHADSHEAAALVDAAFSANAAGRTEEIDFKRRDGTNSGPPCFIHVSLPEALR